MRDYVNTYGLKAFISNYYKNYEIINQVIFN